jgi:hypothetical protein
MQERMNQFRQRMMDRMREQLQMEEEDWDVMQPRIEKVQTLQRQGRGGMGAMFGRMGGRGRRRRPGAEEDEAELEGVAKALAELQEILQDDDADAGDIKEKLTALREAREEQKREMAKARDAVRELCTQRQEAQLVIMGILE